MRQDFTKNLILKSLFNIIKSWKRFYIDFSQFGEEKVIFNILQRISNRKKINPIYIDIGAYNPIEFSNTYKLYQKKWRGVVIDPNKDKIKNWNKIRPNDYVINAAVVENEFNQKKIKIYFDKNNSAGETAYPMANKDKLIYYEASTIKFLEVMRLCEKKFSRPFFLNIDIEGNENNLILELKQISYKIPLICIEFFLSQNAENFSVFNFKQIEGIKYLEDNGYYLVSVCGPSFIFCHKDYWVPYTRL
tara:strand:- start:1758 stop:2498 length:741 start_codon:yes stop_codon:yes gene_type:complete